LQVDAGYATRPISIDNFIDYSITQVDTLNDPQQIEDAHIVFSELNKRVARLTTELNARLTAVRRGASA
jgi:hypothetical protein